MALKDKEHNSADDLQVSLDTDWYKPSITVSKCDKVIKQIAREVERSMTNLLKFEGKVLIFPVIYNEVREITNEIVQPGQNVS